MGDVSMEEEQTSYLRSSLEVKEEYEREQNMKSRVPPLLLLF